MEEALAFAAEGRVKATIETHPLDSINEIFERLKTGRVNGRVVLAIGRITMTITPIVFILIIPLFGLLVISLRS